jgi:hypothetical protein
MATARLRRVVRARALLRVALLVTTTVTALSLAAGSAIGVCFDQ